MTSILYRHAFIGRATDFGMAAIWTGSRFDAGASGAAAQTGKLLPIGLETPAGMASVSGRRVLY